MAVSDNLAEFRDIFFHLFSIKYLSINVATLYFCVNVYFLTTLFSVLCWHTVTTPLLHYFYFLSGLFFFFSLIHFHSRIFLFILFPFISALPAPLSSFCLIFFIPFVFFSWRKEFSRIILPFLYTTCPVCVFGALLSWLRATIAYRYLARIS